MKTYRIVYSEHGIYSDDKNITVKANSKEEAWGRAVYEVLDTEPYSAYVESYITKSGKVHYFNTCHGCRY